MQTDAFYRLSFGSGVFVRTLGSSSANDGFDQRTSPSQGSGGLVVGVDLAG